MKNTVILSQIVQATAMTHGLSYVCDPYLKPKRGDPHEQQLLTENQNFVYAVLCKTLQTDFGRALVREHEHDKDAQQILHEHQHHTHSEFSRAEVLMLTAYVGNLKHTDNWRGITPQFLLHFKEQLRLLDSLVPLDEQLPDSTRIAFLQRAVEDVPDIRRVRILDVVMTAKSGSFTTITYEGYCKLLDDASFHHDKTLSEGSRGFQIKAHEVFTEPSQETHDYYPSPQDDPKPTVEEDTLVETYEVHMSDFKPKDNSSRVVIPEILWKKFSSEDWKLIIEYNKKIPPMTWSPSSGNTRTLPNTPKVPDGGNQEASLATKDKKKDLMHQIILPMKKHLAMINSSLPWSMKPSMPLLTSHHLILTKFCQLTEPTQEHLRHPTSSPK